MGQGTSTPERVHSDYVNVVVLDCCGNNSKAQGVDFTTPVQPTDSALVRTWKVLLRYFQSSFETYGRTVRLVEYYDANFSYATSGQAKSEAALALAVEQQYHPFAVIDEYSHYGPALANVFFAKYGIEAFYSDIGQFPRIPLERSDIASAFPYFWSFLPSIDELISEGAAWVCNSIKDQPVSMSNDPRMNGQPRRIALGYDQTFEDAPPNLTGNELADMLDGATRDRCGYSFADKVELEDASGNQTNPGVATTAVARMIADHDTSVLCVLCTITLGDQFGTAESRYGYLPEYLFIAGDADDSTFARATKNPATWNNSFGITWRWRMPPWMQTYWYRAYGSVDASNVIDPANGWAVYEELMQLFSAMQLAGPYLDPTHVAGGLLSWQRHAQLLSPAAGYAADDAFFMRGMVEEKWDSAGIPPGGPMPFAGSITNNQAGCYRMIDNGTRYFSSTWPHRDDAPAAGAPCTADDYGSA